MKDHSDDEEGFIGTSFEITEKDQKNILPQMKMKRKIPTKGGSYRLADGFMKKQPQLVFFVDDVKPGSFLEGEANKRSKRQLKFTHPVDFYGNNDFKLLYCRKSVERPFVGGDLYMNHEISLRQIESQQSIRELRQFQLPKIKQQQQSDSLWFDSKFQGGNLYCAFQKVRSSEYHLFIQNDTNSYGYNQRFYFCVGGFKKKVKYLFKIVNYKKMMPFYKRGMRIFKFTKPKNQNGFWSRDGQNMEFYQSSIKVNQSFSLYTLSFQIKFSQNEQYAFLSSDLPYSYSKLLWDIQNLENKALMSKHANFEVSSVCNTLCGNSVPEITITSKEIQKEQKHVIIFLARQHPGEFWSSHLAYYVMNLLLEESPESKFILSKFIIKIYPMVNIDGVIYGNFRCDITGVDLNRRWKEPSRIFHPQLYQIKKKISYYHKKYKVDISFDLHGHSKNYNIFCYSCKHNSYTCRILPLLLQHYTPLFYFPSCTFGLTRYKQNTARAIISKITRSQSVLTIETSAYGSRQGLNIKSFEPQDMNIMAESIIKSLNIFCDKKNKKYKEIEKEIKDNFSIYSGYGQEQQEDGSDSDPEKDEIDFKVKIKTVFDKKYQSQVKHFIKEEETTQLHQTSIIFGQKMEESFLLQKKNYDQNVDSKITLNQKKTNYGILRRSKGKRSSFHQSIDQICDRKPNFSTKGMTKRKQAVKLVQQVEKQKTIDPNSSMSFRQRQILPSVRYNKEKLENQGVKQEQVVVNQQPIKQEPQNEAQNLQRFYNKFQRFIPSNYSNKNSNSYFTLEENLNNDDPFRRLGELFQNKRKIEVERIKINIKNSTNIAERQSKILSKSSRNTQIVDFKKFKTNVKFSKQKKKLSHHNNNSFFD